MSISNATLLSVELLPIQGDITYTDGVRETLARRERPQWVMGPDGLPTHLMTGVKPAAAGAETHKGQVWTMAVELL